MAIGGLQVWSFSPAPPDIRGLKRTPDIGLPRRNSSQELPGLFFTHFRAKKIRHLKTEAKGCSASEVMSQMN